MLLGEGDIQLIRLSEVPVDLERTTIGSKSESSLVNIEVDPMTQAVVETISRMMEARQ